MRHFRNRQRAARRTGFTLFEMLLVLAIVSLIAGLSWPRLARRLQEHDLRSNAEQVRRVVDSARVKAIQQGVIYQFRYEPHGHKFLLAPYELPPPQQESPNTTFNAPPKSIGHIYELTETSAFFPPEQTLGNVMPLERLPPEFLSQIANGLMHQDVAWSPPILFHPDGSATSGHFYVRDTKAHRIRLAVRGLTGTVYVSKLEYLPEGYRAL